MADPADFMPAFAKFIQASPTSYHAAATMAELLTRAGFRQLDEKQPWQHIAGRCFVLRGGAVLAWIAPEHLSPSAGARIVGSHTDSPALKLKPNPVVPTAGWQQVNMEVYGGPLLNSLLDRELGLAGRIVDRDGQLYLVQTGPIMRVSQLAPHLDRSVNESLSLDKQFTLLPSYAVECAGGRDVVDLLCQQAGIDPSQYVFGDIFSYPTQAPEVFGPDAEFFASARLDNLSSVFAGLAALLRLDGDQHDVVVLAAFDHEEVGSGTTSGASGPFLSDVLARLGAGYHLGPDDYRAWLARSSCLSADAAHSVNPNYVGKYDPVVRPIVNGGPVLKVNANQRYATDAAGAALWARACQDAGVPNQVFVSNNDVPCGSTIGPITATRLGITTFDVGIPLLSMHSMREMCGTADPHYLSRAVESYWLGA